MNNCTPILKCVCCNGANLTQILDLGEQPLANSYLTTPDEEENLYPLGVNFCNECSHLQLTHRVNPDLLFKHYLYVSGTTKTLREYFDYFVTLVEQYIKVENPNVLDIACNDGSQLDSFKKMGYNTFGIDPATNLHQISSKNHIVICDYLTELSIAKLNTKFSVIVAQNVLAHNANPIEFLSLCRKHLSEDGLIFIQTSQANMVEYGQFDTVYHEHISFFNVKSMTYLAKQSGLYLTDVTKTDIHGTSYVFVLSANPNDDRSEILISKDYPVSAMAVIKFSENAKKSVDDLKTKLNDKEIVIGYGAAAKANTVLNFGKIKLDYIVDDNPLKQNLYTPGMRIKIVSNEFIKEKFGSKDVVWVPLSWNFFKEISSNIKQYRPENNDTFVQLNFTKL